MNRAIRRVGIAVTVLILLLIGQLTYFQVVDANKLETRPAQRAHVGSTNTTVHAARSSPPRATSWRARCRSTTDTEFDYQREYPLGGLFAQIAGYQSFVVGNAGVEKSYDRVLTGREKKLDIGNLAGILQGKQDTQNVVLSLRHDLQQLAADQLEGRKGSVVVIDTKTGARARDVLEPHLRPEPARRRTTRRP